MASRLPERPDATALAASKLAEQIGGELILVYVAEELSTIPELHASTGEDPDGLRAQMIEEIEQRAAALLDLYNTGAPAGVLLVEGDVTEQIIRVATEKNVDYLVIGTEGRSTLSQIMLGSTSHRILKHAPCPVLVVPAHPEMR